MKEYKDTSIPIGGSGQPNEKTINSMQNFYEIAICQNLNDKHEIKTAIGAILFHALILQMLNLNIAFVQMEKVAGVNIKRT